MQPVLRETLHWPGITAYSQAEAGRYGLLARNSNDTASIHLPKMGGRSPVYISIGLNKAKCPTLKKN